MMAEYQNLNSHFHFKSVDPQEKPEVAQEYGAQHMGDVIMSSVRKQPSIPTEPAAK